jgi:serine/threonine-protein kinase
MPGPQDRPQDRPQPGALPAGLEFVRLLGTGADGWVCLARDVGPDRLVAVKAVLGGALIPGGSARLVREARVLASLRHPNVVRIHRLLTLGEDVALCEEFVDGPSLTQALNDPCHELRAPGPARLGLLLEVTEALEHCAERGVVHRDLKPGNILLTQTGSAKVADFGLARLSMAAAAFRTSPGLVSGTPGYWAPEQLRDPDHERPETDYYSFAVVALEVLTGRRIAAAGIHELVDLLPLELQPAFDGGLAADPSVRWSPRQLMGAVLASGWHGIRAVGPETLVAGASASGDLTVPGGRPAAPEAPEPTWITPSVRTSTVMTHHHADPQSSEGSSPLDWVQPATMPITPVPWWRRHPEVVGLAAGIVAAGIVVAILQVVTR